MEILVYHPATAVYAKEIGENLNLPSMTISDYGNKSPKGSKPLFIGRNGDNHHNDLSYIDSIRKVEKLSGKDVSVGLIDAHTDILVRNAGDFYKNIDEVATYANWATLGLVNGNFGSLAVVGCVNGSIPSCDHYGTQFISRFSPRFIPDIEIYPAGPNFKTVTTDIRGVNHLYQIERFLHDNPSVRNSCYEFCSNQLRVEWKGVDEFNPCNYEKFVFGSIDLDVLEPGILDSDWSGRGIFSLEDLENIADRLKNSSDRYAFSINGLKEDVVPDKKSVGKLTGLVENLLS